MAERILMNEYKTLSKEPWTNIEVIPKLTPTESKLHEVILTVHFQLINENIYEWSVALIPLNPDSLYYGGYFKAKMTFPKNYPFSPPGNTTSIRLFHYTDKYNGRFQVHPAALSPKHLP